MPANTTNWRLLPLATNDGITNMAIDEAILLHRIKGLVPNTVRLYQWSPSTVSIGRHQSVMLEVDEAEIERRGFQLVRRISGGGAVLHAEGREITYAVVARMQDLLTVTGSTRSRVEIVYDTILRVIQGAVARLSLSATPGIIHCPALLVDGKKISGNAQCIKGNFVLQHGTILLSVDSEEMYKVLKPPEGVTRGRMVRSVKAKVTGLEDFTGCPVSPADFEQRFTESLTGVTGATMARGDLARGEKEMLQALREKYASSEWRCRYP